LYINGQPARSAINQKLGVSLSIGLIGANSYAAFDGGLDELQVYSSALSPFSIDALFSLSQLTSLSVAFIWL
jgi:hypothetical protein